MLGGGQERGFRSGSENVPGIVGMGKAAEIAVEEMEDDGEKLKALRNKLISTVLSEIDGSYLNGHPTKRLPNNANLRFDYIEGEALILSLDMVGVAASSSSACTSKPIAGSNPSSRVNGTALSCINGVTTLRKKPNIGQIASVSNDIEKNVPP